MKMTKPSSGLIAEFKAVVAGLSGAEPRKMFGYDAFFVNGNMAAGLWQDTCVLKLAPADAAEFMKYPGARPFAPMKGRVMTGWLEAPEEVSHDPEALAEWCQRALAFARTLPPKGLKLPAKKSQAKSAKPGKTAKAAKVAKATKTAKTKRR